MIKPAYNRQSRTPSSEQYELMDGDQRLGHLDLHFGSSDVFGTLVLDRDMTEEDAAHLIEQIDEDLVLSAEVPREDFIVRVYVGREIMYFNEDLFRDYMNAADGHDDIEEE